MNPDILLIFYFLIFLLGLIIGSFLNVLIDRLPRQETVLKGRSYCESCKKILAWYDLIPLFSFVWIKGKCRYCYSPLSIQYLIVELLTGALFVGIVLTIGEIRSIREIGIIGYYFFIASSLIAVFFIDLKSAIIPDKIIYPTIIVSFLFLILNSKFLILNYIFSALGAFIFFLALFLVTRGRGMGFGDVKFAFLIGLILGFPQVVIGLYTAFLTGAVTSLILVLWKKKKFKGGTVPFGPFLVLGTLISLFFGRLILEKIMPVLHW